MPTSAKKRAAGTRPSDQARQSALAQSDLQDYLDGVTKRIRDQIRLQRPERLVFEELVPKRLQVPLERNLQRQIGDMAGVQRYAVASCHIQNAGLMRQRKRIRILLLRTTVW